MRFTIDNCAMECVAQLNIRSSEGTHWTVLTEELIRDYDHPVIDGLRVRVGFDETGFHAVIPLDEGELDDTTYIKGKISDIEEWYDEKLDRLIELKRHLEILSNAKNRGDD